MPIGHLDSGGTVITGDSIEYFRLCSMKCAVALELKGIKIRRGVCVWKNVAREFGIERPTKKRVYDWLCAKVEGLRAQQEHQSTVNGRELREVEGKEVQ